MRTGGRRKGGGTLAPHASAGVKNVPQVNTKQPAGHILPVCVTIYILYAVCVSTSIQMYIAGSV